MKVNFSAQKPESNHLTAQAVVLTGGLIGAGAILGGFIALGALLDQLAVGLLAGVAALAVVGLSFALLGTPRLLIPTALWGRCGESDV